MPPERVGERTFARVLRKANGYAVQLVIVTAVLELFLDSAAHLEVRVGRDGDVAGVEEFVDVRAKEDSVVERVLMDVAVVADVRGLERGKRLLVRHRAAPAVGVE